MGTAFKSFGCAVLSFIAGVVIDADHFLDFFLNHPFTLKFSRIYDAFEKQDLSRLYLVLHSYEILVILWLSIYAFSMSASWIALAIGLTQHIIFDIFTNPIRVNGYFFTYRLCKGFKKEMIFSNTKGAEKWPY